MDALLKPFTVLPALDWAAALLFIAAWIGYSRFAKRRAESRPSILASTNRWRQHWMLQATYRENRIVDSAVVQNLSAAPSFFASTSILIIGGLIATLAATDKANDLVHEIPFAARTSVLVLDLKLAVLTAIFIHAFFRFTWSLRQYSFGAILVGSLPDAHSFGDDAGLRRAYADRAGHVMALAAETFNDGLRAYYLSFAAVAWLFSPLAFIAATAIVIFVLYQREFRSEVLVALREIDALDGDGALKAPDRETP